MKITYKNYPALAMLEKDNPLEVRIDEIDMPLSQRDIEEFFLPNFPDFIAGIDRKNVIKPATTFVNTAWKASGKAIFEDEKMFAKDLVGKSGVLITPALVCFYSIWMTRAGNLALSFACFSGNLLIAFSFPDTQINKQGIWLSKNLDLSSVSEVIRNGKGFYLFQKQMVFTLLIFQQYAQVETKILPAGKKVKDILCQHKNETKVDVTLLDCRWFTTLEKTDGFNVRGHFRLQACGKGMSERKIVWINDFQKTGYTAPARKLAQEA
jgi:hypothetical protein